MSLPLAFEIGRYPQNVEAATDCSAQPFGKTTPRPVPPRTGRRLNLFRRAGALGHEHAEPFTTGVCRLHAGIVDADVAIKRWFEVQHPVVQSSMQDCNRVLVAKGKQRDYEAFTTAPQTLH